VVVLVSVQFASPEEGGRDSFENTCQFYMNIWRLFYSFLDIYSSRGFSIEAKNTFQFAFRKL
jgi:hypothetical protein